MEIEILENEAALNERAADIIAETLRKKPDACLVFPVGATPLGLFRVLVQRVQASEMSFSQARLIELDDYYGIALDDPRNLYNWFERELMIPAGIQPAQVTRFQTDTADPSAEVARMEAVVQAQGIDLAVLGIGMNGHLGFNEPGTAFDAPTHMADLTQESILSNAGYWGGEDRVPRQAMTLGLGTLMQAEQIVLMVNGQRKADILSQVMASDPTPVLPATVLKNHANARVLSDAAAAPAQK